MTKNVEINNLKSQVQMLLDRLEDRASQRQYYYLTLSKKYDNVKNRLNTSVSATEKIKLEGYMEGLIEGMVYLNDNLKSGIMPFDGKEFDKEDGRIIKEQDGV